MVEEEKNKKCIYFIHFPFLLIFHQGCLLLFIFTVTIRNIYCFTLNGNTTIGQYIIICFQTEGEKFVGFLETY